MFVVSNFALAFVQLLDMALNLYMWIVIIRALISWVNPDPYNPIVQFLQRVTDPVLNRIRAIIPMGGLGIDLSPMILIFLIIFLRQAVIGSLYQLAHQIG